MYYDLKKLYGHLSSK
jgi:hypothetical protein